MIVAAVLFERFIGRDEELRYLVDVRARAVKSASGSAISIIGEAGVGKSRLLTEFERATHAERGGFVRVRCDELPIPYAPLRAVLQSIAQLRELRRSEGVLSEIEAVRLLLATADPGGTSDAGGRKHEIFRRVVSVLGLAASRLGALTIVIDDVHWSDVSTLEALRLVARDISAFPMVLALAYRADDLAADHTRAIAVAAIEREHVDRMTLGSLTFGDVADLLRRIIPHASTGVIRGIYDLSEGRPYIVEELARSVVERGVDGDLEATLSLRSAVLSRFLQLNSRHREIIERAAVLGRNFLPGDLGALDIPAMQLVDALRAGRSLQLLEERDVNGKPWFRFRHALTREILYRNLLAIERRALHLRIADDLAAFDDRIVEYAYHVSAAGDVPRAVAANERAGDRACEVLAFADAAKLFARALDFAGGAEALGRIGHKLALSLERVGDVDGLLAACPGVAERVASGGAPQDALRILIVVVRGIARYKFPESVAQLERARTLLDSTTPPDLRFDFEVYNAMVLRMNGRHAEALEACGRADRCVLQRSASRTSELVRQRALCLFESGNIMRAREILESELSIRSGTDTFEELRILSALASVYRTLGRPREAFAHYSSAGAICERLGYDGEATIHRCYAAGIAGELGDFAFARAVAERLYRDGTSQFYFLDIALLLAARATGGDVAPFLAMFDRACAEGPLFLVQALASNLPPMLDDDRALGRAIVRRGLDLVSDPNDVLGFLFVTFEFGSEVDVARAVALYRQVEIEADVLGDMLDAALANANIAQREHRTIEARAHASRAADIATASEDWLNLIRALELKNDVDGVRTELRRLGATAELARFDLRHPPGANAVVHRTERLTRREEQIARAYASGASSREVGDRLAITHRTVETHLANVYLKLGVNTRAELVEHFASLA